MEDKKMHKYQNAKEKQLEELICNCCGKSFLIENGIVKEGVCSVDCLWGYFSEKDGERHQFDLCEACYDKITENFKIPVEKIPEKELL